MESKVLGYSIRADNLYLTYLAWLLLLSAVTDTHTVNYDTRTRHTGTTGTQKNILGVEFDDNPDLSRPIRLARKKAQVTSS